MKTRKGFTLVEVLIIVAVIALLATIAIPNLLRARVNAHDAFAKASLKAASTAMENYLAANSAYPPDIAALTGVTPPYLHVDYFDGNTYHGFTFTVDTLTGQDYILTAEPVSANLGSGSFTISTGAILVEN